MTQGSSLATSDPSSRSWTRLSICSNKGAQQRRLSSLQWQCRHQGREECREQYIQTYTQQHTQQCSQNRRQGGAQDEVRPGPAAAARGDCLCLYNCPLFRLCLTNTRAYTLCLCLYTCIRCCLCLSTWLRISCDEGHVSHYRHHLHTNGHMSALLPGDGAHQAQKAPGGEDLYRRRQHVS
jgi:hypothetical protein